MLVLEGHGVPYTRAEYPDTLRDAEAVADYLEVPPETVYKTLVVEVAEPGHRPLLVLVAANAVLDLKKVAAVLGVKKAAMARHADAERLTGLQVGGISALALLNRGFAIYIDEWATLHDTILISAGQRGLNLRLAVDDLIRVTGAHVADVSTD